jgi:hypothetical protein
MSHKDVATHHTVTKCLKFESAAAYQAAKDKVDALMEREISPSEVPGVVELAEREGNILVNLGINGGIWPLVCEGDYSGVDPFNEANAQIGVGDNDGGDYEDPTDTDLMASVNKEYVGMDAGFPTYGTLQKATWQAEFGEAVANFDWEEWCVNNGDGVMLNRKVESLGTKSGGVWVLRVSIELS